MGGWERVQVWTRTEISMFLGLQTQPFNQRRFRPNHSKYMPTPALRCLGAARQQGLGAQCCLLMRGQTVHVLQCVCAGWGGEGAGRAINQRFHKQPFQEHVPMLLLQGFGAARQQGLGGSMLPADAGAKRACAAVRVCRMGMEVRAQGPGDRGLVIKSC
jgi:hypothetical protein